MSIPLHHHHHHHHHHHCRRRPRRRCRYSTAALVRFVSGLTFCSSWKFVCVSGVSGQWRDNWSSLLLMWRVQAPHGRGGGGGCGDEKDEVMTQ
ncbi:hypothetical protein E2C01_101945 [Portunus trituberculatus]|uniref:Uncharacterized protein n=1 Tax=Portunus trituberculatus TaxID=210409 RepID=A0A5B7KH36_PORTR|nr:hypothetical protein [Portunus trituberculatus]